MEGSYGPSFSMNTSNSKKGSTSTQPAQQEGGTETGPAQQRSEGAGAADPAPARDAGLQAEANLPDPMVAADDGSQPHDAAAADLPGRMDVGDGNGGTRSKL